MTKLDNRDNNHLKTVELPTGRSRLWRTMFLFKNQHSNKIIFVYLPCHLFAYFAREQLKYNKPIDFSFYKNSFIVLGCFIT